MTNITQPVRVVIADDHRFFREGLKFHLGQYSKQLEIVDDSENGKQLIQAVKTYTPDVVVTDIRMPQMDGIEASSYIHSNYPSVKIVALSNFDEATLIYEMFQAGANGYVLKNSSCEEVVDAIASVNSGKMYYCNSASKTLVKLIASSRFNDSKALRKINFSDNEIAIIRMICQQRTTKEIAAIMQLSIKSIENYSKNIKEKTEAKNMVGIALFAVKNGIININDF